MIYCECKDNNTNAYKIYIYNKKQKNKKTFSDLNN